MYMRTALGDIGEKTRMEADRWSQKLGDWAGIHTGMADWLGPDGAENPTVQNPAGSSGQTFGTFERADSTEPAVATGS